MLTNCHCGALTKLTPFLAQWSWYLKWCVTLECESEITFKRSDIIRLPVEKLLSGEMVTMLIVCVALCYMLLSMFYFKLYLLNL